MLKILKLPAPVDAHVHFRRPPSSVLPSGWFIEYVRQHGRLFEYALVMPNTDPDILTVEDVDTYRKLINQVCIGITPLMTIKLMPKTPIDTILKAREHGVTAFKLYPDGVTTNSEGGFTAAMLMHPSQHLYPLLKVLEEMDIVLSVHAEMPGEFCMERETQFLYVLREIMRHFPKLRVVVEHITSRFTLDFIRMYEGRMAGTITLHHLLNTLDDVLGDKLNPHAFCKPIPKTTSDRSALFNAATGKLPYFFLGSDSAPHEKHKKECKSGCAGCYTAPHLMESLTEMFVKYSSIEKLIEFTSTRARLWYGLADPGYEIVMVNTPWVVPNEVDGAVPLSFGKTVEWMAPWSRGAIPSKYHDVPVGVVTEVDA